MEFNDIDTPSEKAVTPTIDDAEMDAIFEGIEDLDGWKRLKSLPKAEQEAFISSLTIDALEENTPAAAEKTAHSTAENSQTGNLSVEETAKDGIIRNRNTTKGIGIQYFANRGLDKQSDKELQRSIKSWTAIVEKHKDKVNNPAKHDKGWDIKDEREKAGLIKHWKKEIRNAENSIKEANALLVKRKKEIE